MPLGPKSERRGSSGKICNDLPNSYFTCVTLCLCAYLRIRKLKNIIYIYLFPFIHWSDKIMAKSDRFKSRKPLKSTWEAAICFDSLTISKLLRNVLKELEYKFTRDKTEKPFTRLMLVVPLPRFAYAFQFKICTPSEFIINIYDTKPTPSGTLHFIEVRNIDEGNIDDIKKVLQSLAANMPRKPWKFFWSERFRYAIAGPEYLRAKGAWNKMGVV